MSTFKELQDRLQSVRFKSTIYQHLIDHLETEFRPISGGSAKKVLMTEDKIKVPDDLFEQVIGDLYIDLQDVDAEANQIMSQPVAITTDRIQS